LSSFFAVAAYYNENSRLGNELAQLVTFLHQQHAMHTILD